MVKLGEGAAVTSWALGPCFKKTQGCTKPRVRGGDYLACTKAQEMFGPIQAHALQAQITFGKLSLPSVQVMYAGAESRLVSASLTQTLFEVQGFPLLMKEPTLQMQSNRQESE